MKSILIVDDNKLNLATARAVLSDNYKVIPVMKGQQALSYLEREECDIILLDINMPDMDGFEVLEKIREMEHCRNIPVIFLTADSDAETETRCFNKGAVDFIAKPFVPEVMLSRIGRALELEELRSDLANMLEQKTREVSDIKSKSQQDALTGLWDRAYTEETVNRLLKDGANGAFMMIDIDNFKSINDSYGHATGDIVLKMLAITLQDLFSEEDILCRIGGDEFVVFMKDVSSKEQIGDRAAKLISRLRNKVNVSGAEISTSISVGIALTPEDGTRFTELYSCADKALYYVKRNGKSSYTFYGDRLRKENDRASETVDLKYLQEFMGRRDSEKGSYLLNLESFQYVYNFIKRFIQRSGMDVLLMLFTIDESESTQAMDVLEKTMCMCMRRSDVVSRYSNRQLVSILMDANVANSATMANRVIDNFNRQYTGEPVHLEYSIARMGRRQDDELADIL